MRSLAVLSDFNVPNYSLLDNLPQNAWHTHYGFIMHSHWSVVDRLCDCPIQGIECDLFLVLIIVFSL